MVDFSPFWTYSKWTDSVNTLLPFKMLTTTQILESIEPGEWFASIGMKDTEMIIQHVQFLSLKVNWDKSNLNPWQQRVFVGISRDSQLVMASLSHQRVMKLSSLAQSFHLNRRMKLIQFQQLMGMIAAAATVIPLGLLRARPLQRLVNSANLHPKLDRHVRMRVTQICIQMLRPWKNKRLLSQGAPLGNISARRSVITTDASLMGWGAIWEGRSVRGFWEPPWTLEHINVLELRAVYLSLRAFLPSLQNKHVLVKYNMSALYHIKHRWKRNSKAVNIPGVTNKAADLLSRTGPLPRECGKICMGTVQYGEDRSVCNSRDSSLQSMVLPEQPGRSNGISRMAGQVVVCFSFSTFDSLGAQEGSTVSSQSLACGPKPKKHWF